MDLLDIVISVFFSVASILGANKFFPAYFKEKGKNYATKEDIEEITTKIESVKEKYDSLKQIKQRYSSHQFDLYNELWRALIDLKVSADTLWNKITRTGLKDFANKVFKAKNMIEKSALLIETEHYEKLMAIMQEFEKFQFGKLELIKLRNLSVHEQDFDEHEIFNIVEANRIKKEEYTSLLNKLKKDFIKQIKGENS
jgi:hypothetical protein